MPFIWVIWSIEVVLELWKVSVISSTTLLLSKNSGVTEKQNSFKIWTDQIHRREILTSFFTVMSKKCKASSLHTPNNVLTPKQGLHAGRWALFCFHPAQQCEEEEAA